MDRVAAEQLDADDELSYLRERYVVGDSGPIYMDGNSLGRPAKGTQDAIANGLREWAEQLVGGWDRWIELPARVGDRLGAFLGSAQGQVAISDSTTVNLYKLAGAALAARPERHKIVGDADDFPTDRYVLEGLAESTGRRLDLLKGSAIDGLDLEALGAAVDDDTALVCLSHVNYRSGSRHDMAAVTDLVHRSGALVLWDLCHSAGAVPVCLDSAGADLAVGCTYKYLNGGPGSPAFLYVSSELQRELRQPIWGWFGQRDQFTMGPSYDPVPGVERFLTGTPQVIGILSIEAALAELETAGIEALWEKSQRLTAMLVNLVCAELEPLGARLASPSDPDHRGAHVSVAHDRAWQWCAQLIARRLVTGDFRSPDVVRLGPAPSYTRFVDVYDAVERMAMLLLEGLPDDPAGRPRVT